MAHVNPTHSHSSFHKTKREQSTQRITYPGLLLILKLQTKVVSLQNAQLPQDMVKHSLAQVLFLEKQKHEREKKNDILTLLGALSSAS